MIKRLITLLLIFATLFLISSCGGDKYSHAELVIDLGDNFYSANESNFDKSYTDGKNVVAIQRLSFEAAYRDGIGETHTPSEFGRLWLLRTGNERPVETDGEVSYATYYVGEGDEEFLHLAAFYRSRHAYFVVIFATQAGAEIESTEEFLSYAKTVHFK